MALERRPIQIIPRSMLAAETVYLAGLGVVFGSRMLMLKHQGRSSGVRHHVGLKVLDRTSELSWVVESRNGVSSNWYPNVISNPHVS